MAGRKREGKKKERKREVLVEWDVAVSAADGCMIQREREEKKNKGKRGKRKKKKVRSGRAG